MDGAGDTTRIALLVATYVVVLGGVPMIARRRGRRLLFGTLLGHFTFWSSWFATGATFQVSSADATIAALVAGGAPRESFVRLSDAVFAPERAVKIRVGGRKKGSTSYVARYVPVFPAGGDAGPRELGPATVVWFEPTPTDTLPTPVEGRLTPLEADTRAKLAAAGLKVARPAWLLDTSLPGWRGPLGIVLLASAFGWGLDLLSGLRGPVGAGRRLREPPSRRAPGPVA